LIFRKNEVQFNNSLRETQLLKALIFDFDGLILDTETPDLQAWQEIYKHHGQVITLQTWGQIVGGTGNSVFDPASHLQSLLGYPIDLPAIKQLARQLSDAAILQQPILPGARELLETARNKPYQLAIASSSPHDWVDNHLKRLGLFDYFEAILCGDDVIRTKPDPGLYLAALRALNVQATEAVVFEDSPNGFLAANAAGIFSVAVPIPLTSQLGVGHARLVLGSLEEVSLADLEALLAGNR
jgi:putative hydrolase of the HAD superfamily